MDRYFSNKPSYISSFPFLPLSSRRFVSIWLWFFTCIDTAPSSFLVRQSSWFFSLEKRTVPPSFESHHTAGDTLTHDDTSIPMNSGQIHVIQTRSFFFFLFFFFFFKAYLITLSILCWLIIHRVRKYQEISSQKVKLDGFDQKLGSLSKDVIIGE